MSDERKDSKLRAQLGSTFLDVMTDPREFASAVFGRKFADGNASYAIGGDLAGAMEVVDALNLECACRMIEAVAAGGHLDTDDGKAMVGMAAARINAVDDHGLVPPAVIIARVLRAQEATGGKFKLVTLGEDGAAYLGCGDPECPGCGGDGSLIGDNKEEEVTPVPQSETTRHLH